MSASPWLTSEQAARRLGVKPETLYAYVSRGLIRSERIPGQRRSRFSRIDVERQATRSRRGGRAGGLEVIIETALTHLDPAGDLSYRGWSVQDAAMTSTFEVVASWLWTGERDDIPFTASPEHHAVVARYSPMLDDLDPMARLRMLLVPLRDADPFHADRRPTAVATTARSVLGASVEAMPVLGATPRAGASIAARLWPRLTAAPPSVSRVRALDAILITLADHEMAASTLAARVAASTWADPYLVLMAGLAVLGGPLHGGASEQARALIRDATETSAAGTIGRRLGNGDRIPGFGHRVYETRDPRAELVLELIGHPIDTAPVVAELLDVMQARSLPFPNIDFAIAAVAEQYGFVAGAGELIFAIARTSGWLAHAIEEYEHALRYRTRAAYVGPPTR